MSKNFLAANLATIRWWSRLSQKAFADKLGVNTATISNWERGVCEPSANKLLEIAQLLNDVTIDELITHDLQKRRHIFVE